MAEEPIVIPVSDDGGTERLIQLLRDLGVIGDQTFAKIIAGTAELSRSEQDIVNNQLLMNAAFNAGLSDATRLGEILDSLSGIELKMAAETPEVVAAIQDLGIAEQAAALAAKEMAEAAAQEAASFEALVAGAAEAAKALQGEMAASSEGTSVAMAYRAANFQVAESETAKAEASVSATAAMKEAGAGFSSLIADIAAYTGAISALHDIDVYESVKQQLQSVAGAGKDVSGAFDQLANIAAKSQQPIEAVGRAVSTFYAGIKQNGGTLEDAIKETGGLAQAIFNTNTPAAAATRVIHDFSEAIAQGKLQGQQFNSAMRQAPAVMELIARAAGTTAEGLKGMSAQQLLAVLSGSRLQAINDELAKQAEGTLKGAFVSLNDKVIQYIGTTGQADAVTKTFASAMTLIGNNLTTVIPIVEAFFAAFAVAKIISIATSIGTALVGAVTALIGGLTTAAAILGPFGLAIVGIGLAVAAVITYFGGWQNTVNAISTAWATFTERLQRGAQVAKSDVVSAFEAVKSGLSAAGQYASECATKVENLVSEIGEGIQGKAVDAVNLLKEALSAIISVLSTVIDTVKEAVQWFEQLFQAKEQAESVNANENGTGHARSGASWTVPGGSGVDSRLIAVSPGEHVTVTTPSQHYGHTDMPTNAPVVGRFRDGGVYAAFQAANDNSVSGFGAPDAGKYYTKSDGTDYSAKSIRENDARRAAEAAAAAAKAAQEAAAAAAQRAAMQAQIDALRTSTAVSNSTTSTAATSAVKSAAGIKTGGTATSGQAATTPDGNGGTQADFLIRQRKQKALAADSAAIIAASVVTAINGFSKPDDSLALVGGPISIGQAREWTTNGYGWFPSAGALAAAQTITYAGDRKAAEKKYAEDQQKPYSAFRDGGSFSVPGGSGVDSRLVQMLVSPGEQVDVKTPAQQQSGQAGQPRSAPVINFTVQTKDANSFGASKRQVASDLKRAMGKVS